MADRVTHTPGPWVAGWSGDPETESLDDAGPITVVSVGRGCVAECRPIRTGHASTWPIVRANAHLIAAAPDLLAAARRALEEMRHTVAPRDSFTDAVDALDAAITKATVSPMEPTDG